MDIISHVLFGHILANQSFSWQILIGSIIPDLDKPYTAFVRKKFRKADSRTWWQELPFLSLLSGFAIVFGFFGVAQGIMAHFFLDFMTGETEPFSPFSRKRIDFNLSIPKKIILGGIIWAYFLLLLI